MKLEKEVSTSLYETILKTIAKIEFIIFSFKISRNHKLVRYYAAGTDKLGRISNFFKMRFFLVHLPYILQFFKLIL